MPNITNTLTYKAVMDTKGFKQGSDQVQRGLGNTGAAAAGVGKGMSTMNKAIGAFIVAGSAKAVGDFALDATAMAQAAEKAADSAGRVLGPQAEQLASDFEKLRTAAGLSVGEFDGLLAQMGLMTDGMVATDEAQAGYIGRMLDMSAALAQFNPHGGDTADALEAIFSGLKNSFNPLEAFGLKLKAADIQERADELQAMDDGLERGEAELLAFIEIMEERGNPAMDAYDENLSDVNTQQAELNAAWKTTKERIGGMLAGPLMWLLNWLNDVADAWIRLTDETKFYGTVLGQFWLWANKTGDAISEFVLKPINAVTDAVKTAWSWLQKVLNSPVLSKVGEFLGNAIIPGSVGGKAAGGMVPGPKGQPRLIMAHGGETVSGLGDTHGGGGGITVNISTLAGDPQATARAVVEALEVYQRSNGPVPIDVGGAR